MPSGYAEMTEWIATAAFNEDFQVNPREWWHFDYKDWKQYPIVNLKFEDLGL
jgi:D-alanyl-D-alanine dipeptidase